MRCSLSLSKHLQLQLASFVRCTQRSLFLVILDLDRLRFPGFLFFLSFFSFLFFRSFFLPFLPEDDSELLEKESLPEDDELFLDFLLFFPFFDFFHDRQSHSSCWLALLAFRTISNGIAGPGCELWACEPHPRRYPLLLGLNPLPWYLW